MAEIRVAVMGCGKPRTEAGATGFGMAHAHMRGYRAAGNCRLVAVADTVRENAEAFVARYDAAAAVYTEYESMLAETTPDVVSICTWPHLHAPMVLAAIRAGARAIHCEKPMAGTWGEARAMHAAAVESGVQLTFNHQRRFLAPFQTARRLLREGALGDLLRLEGSCDNLMDWGTHWLDMFCFLNEEQSATWVLGQVDCRATHTIFGLVHEDQGLCEVMYANAVRGLLFTGMERQIGCALRAQGTHGVLEIHDKAPHVRLSQHHRAGWQVFEADEGLHGDAAIERGVADLLAALASGAEPELSSYKCIRSTEVAFAAYESSRRRGRVDLPLDIDDHPLQELYTAAGS